MGQGQNIFHQTPVSINGPIIEQMQYIASSSVITENKKVIAPT
jgi:hypothetical protein